MIACRCKRGYDESVVISTRPGRAGVGDRCDKLPFTAGKSREAIEVTIAGSAVTVVWCGFAGHADLKGTQIWNDDGKSISRDCSGTIKRPLCVFLPRDGKQP
jgi:hypothetical protein